MIDQYAQNGTIASVCEALEVSVSGYYAWKGREVSQHEQNDKQLSQQVAEIYQASRGTYGSERIHQALRQQGIYTSRKRVARLMAEHRLCSVRVKKGRKSCTKSVTNRYIVPNRVQQQFYVQGVHQLWFTDTTFIPTAEGWLYLVTVLDSYSRQIVGWAMGLHHDAQLATKALHMAITHHQPKAGLIIHSDRGSEFANGLFAQTCADAGIVRSMSAKGKCYDNAIAESFFATLKLEAVQGCTFDTHIQARMVLFDYIEVFYNRQRLHSGIGFVTPVSRVA
jgi:transposase InsO family protein